MKIFTKKKPWLNGVLDTGLQSCCGDYYVLWLRLLHCADDDDDDDDVSLETWLQKIWLQPNVRPPALQTKSRPKFRACMEQKRRSPGWNPRMFSKGPHSVAQVVERKVADGG